MQVSAARDYQKANVTTADRVRIVVMCYEGCIANASRAQDEMRKGNVAGKGVYLSKATAIVSELLSTLDKDRGGEIAERLEILYRYVLHTFTQANIRQDPGLMDGALRVLRELRDGWAALAEKGVGR
jgi:flagellar secretion chaperone FliS